jgi:hypothetical protein
VEKYCKPTEATDNITGCMRFACCITQATGYDSEYVILIAFPRQQWLGERAPVWRYTFIKIKQSYYRPGQALKDPGG